MVTLNRQTKVVLLAAVGADKEADRREGTNLRISISLFFFLICVQRTEENNRFLPAPIMTWKS